MTAMVAGGMDYETIKPATACAFALWTETALVATSASSSAPQKRTSADALPNEVRCMARLLRRRITPRGVSLAF